MKNRLLAKLDGLISKYHETQELHDKSKDLEQHEYSIQTLALIDTIKKLNLELVSSLPDDKMEELHAKMEGIVRNKVGEAEFKTVSAQLKGDPNLKTPEQKKFYMIYNCPNSFIFNGVLREFFEQAAEYADQDKLGRALENIDNYKSDYLYNVKVYPLRDRVEELKKKNAERVSDPEKLKALNEELDSIAELVVTSSKNYSWNNGDLRDKVFLRIGNRRVDALNEKSLKEDDYKHLNKYFCVDKNGEYQGSRSIHETRVGDPNLAKDFNLDKAKMVIPEDKKNAIRNALAYMREKNMIPKNVSAEEKGGKIYGFVNLYNAHNKLVGAIEGDDLDAIRDAKAEYIRELENMRGLYALIKEQFGPDDNMMVGNITSYRESWLPNEFKNDLPVNIYVSAIFNLNATLQNNNVSLDELFEDPSNAFFKVMKNMSAKLMPDAHMSHDSISDAIATISEGKSTGYFTQLGLPRNLEFLHSMTFHEKEYEQNALAMMLLQTYSIYITNLGYSSKFSKMQNYLDTNAAETIANIMLVNPADRDYNRLKAFDDMSYDGMEKIPAFDTLGYLTSHDVPAGELTARIKNTISELSQKSIKSQIGITQDDMMMRSVEAAQLAAIQYLAVYPAPVPGVMSKSEYNALKQIAEKPEVAFAKSLSKALVTKIREARTYQKLTENGKNQFEIAKRNAKNSEKLYNARMDAINGKLAELNSSLLDAEEDAEISAITDEMTKLEHERNILHEIEIARLEREYLCGNLTKDYFEQRKYNVSTGAKGNYKDTVPFGADEYPSFSAFKEQYKDELENKTLTKADVENLYNRKIENARFEEKKLSLMKAANHPTPALKEKSAFANAFLNAREAAREAELIYKRELIDLTADQKNLRVDIRNAENVGKDATELKEQLEQCTKKEAELLASELERLDKAYTDGLIPRDYYEQRKLNVQNGTPDEKVPFGTDEYPAFDKFKEKYSEELNNGELSMEDAQMFYDRMIENAIMTENDFMLVNSGNAPAPTLDAPDEVRYHIEIPELNGNDGLEKSSKISQHDVPTVNKEKCP